MVVVDGVVYRTLDALHYPWTVAAILLVGDKLLTVGGAAERTSVGQLGAILVVRTADGEGELGDIALEGAQVLAEDALKLVQAEQRLAGESLHEVLVGIGSRGVVEEILAQGWWQQPGKEGGLHDASLAHEDEYHLVYHAQRNPCHHHRHEPLLEEIAKELLGVLVIGAFLDLDAVG